MEQKDLWVFGYGSLIWEPGFDVAEKQIARVHGFRRSFCMWSIHHRGTVEEPGLVLALDSEPEGFCDGVALRAHADQTEQVLAYLRERELISSAYLEETCSLTLRDGREVEAVSYVVDKEHVQYCSGLSLERQAEVIANAVGGRGPNPEYLYNTASQLHALGIHDAELDLLVEKVRARTEAR